MRALSSSCGRELLAVCLLAVAWAPSSLAQPIDVDGDGHSAPDDCNDLDPNIYPGAPETCDGLDNNCDGVIDEGVTTTYYLDADLDGHGTSALTTQDCSEPPLFSAVDDDCDDLNPFAYPGAEEVCQDGIDQDCDGYDAHCALPDPFGPLGLPPDPEDIAPPTDETKAYDFYEANFFLVGAVQIGGGLGAIERQRAVVVRGVVLDRDGDPMSGVDVSVVEQPEVGFTRSRADGRYDLMVNGGAQVTLRLERKSLLQADRRLTLPWAEFVEVDPVVVVTRDPVVTEVDFSGSATVQLAKASVVSDADGVRQSRLVIDPGTEAALVLPDGSRIAAPSLSLRATEYTVGPNGALAMPAPLPGYTSYTHCVELSSDEADRTGGTVEFSQPIAYHVENYRGFPAGTVIPAASYDRNSESWSPQEDGVVLEILSVTGGVASIDADGDGLADSAANLTSAAFTTAELQMLASEFALGDTVVRGRVAHFSPYDLNALAEPPPDPEDLDPTSSEQTDENCEEGGSIIDVQSRVLRERIPLAGTPYSLAYSSARAQAFEDSRVIHVTPASIPAGLTAVDVIVQSNGVTERTRYLPPFTTRQPHEIVYTPVDAYGRVVQGRAEILVTVQNHYTVPYVVCRGGYYDGRRRSWGVPVASGCPADATIGGGGIAEGIRQRSERLPAGGWSAGAEGFGGWSVDVRHSYDVDTRALYLGDGRRRTSEEVGLVAEHFAGDPTLGSLNAGAYGPVGDGGPPKQAAFFVTYDVKASPDGVVYVAEALRVRKVDPDGVVTTYAGRGSAAGDVAWAVGDDVVPDPSTIPPEAREGSGTFGTTGDGGPATAALLQPFDMAFGRDGNLYVTDWYAYREDDPDAGSVRVIRPDGIIETFLTVGEIPFAGAIWISPTDEMYLFEYPVTMGSTTTLPAIYRVAEDRSLIRIAGGVPCCDPNEGGAAIEASLHSFESLGLVGDSQGNLYFGNYTGVRRISPDGIVTTVIGAPYHGGISLPQLSHGDVATAGATPRVIKLGIDGLGRLLIGTFDGLYRLEADATVSKLTSTNCTTGIGVPRDLPARQYCPDWSPFGTSPDHDMIYIADRFWVWRITAPFSAVMSLSDGGIAVPDRSGRALHIFDNNGRHLRTDDFPSRARRRAFDYDALGRLASITDRHGRATVFVPGASTNTERVVGSDGHETLLGYDAAGNLARVENENGEVWELGYGSGGLLTSFERPRGNASTFTYDTRGRLLRDQNAAGGYKELAATSTAPGAWSVAVETAEGRVTSYDVAVGGDRADVVTLPDGTTRSSIKEGDGDWSLTTADGTLVQRKITSEPALGSAAPFALTTRRAPPGLPAHVVTRQRSYALPGAVTSRTETVSDNAGFEATIVFDQSLRSWTTTTGEGRVTTRVEDAQGRTSSVTREPLAPTRIEYDPNGRVASVVRGFAPRLRTTSFSYDERGNLDSLTDAEGGTFRFDHDLVGRLVRRIFPDGREVTMSYDANGNLTSLTPPGRPLHALSYDSADRLVDYDPPALSGVTPDNTEYVYDLDGKVQRIDRPDGASVSLSYDSSGRLFTTTIARGSYTRGYHSTTGRLVSLSDPDGGSLGFTWAGALPTSIARTGAAPGTLSISYDAAHRVETRASGGTTIQYGYDTDGLLVEAGTIGALMDVMRDTAGLVTEATRGLVTTTTDYDEFAEPFAVSTSVSGTAELSFEYLRDRLGRVVALDETAGPTTTSYDFVYDEARRLVEVSTNGTVTASYTWDDNSNRLSETTSTGTILATYDDQDRLVTLGDFTYAYNNNGELLSRTDTTNGDNWSYDYDELGNLLQVELPDATQISYALDGLNRRVARYVDGVFDRGWLYQDALNPFAEVDSAGNVDAVYVYATRGHSPDLIVTPSATYRVVSDHLGSVRMVVNTSTGAVVQEMDYDVWGNVMVDTSPGWQPFGFAGGLWDADTGLVRFGARDYDPVAGRWTAKDPIGFGGGDTNLYGYVLQDPVNWVDPSGLCPGCDQSIPDLGEQLRALVEAFHDAALVVAPDDGPMLGSSLQERNALIHCIASCNLARDFGDPVAFGVSQGREVLQMTAQPPGNQFNDMQNNDCGLRADDSLSCRDSCLTSAANGSLGLRTDTEYPDWIKPFTFDLSNWIANALR